MKTNVALALLLDPCVILHSQGLAPDPWQRALLQSSPLPSAGEGAGVRGHHQLLNCSRQAGKSTTVAALALHQMLAAPGSLVLLVAPAERQSHELFRKVVHAYQDLEQPVASIRANQSELELANGSRLVALPGREETVRSFSGVNLLLIDEASRVPDDLYRAVRPMLAVSRGGSSHFRRRSASAAGFTRSGSAPGPGSASTFRGRSARAFCPSSLPRRRARWVRSGSIRSTTGCSRPWRGWSIPSLATRLSQVMHKQGKGT